METVINENNFSAVIASDKPVIIDFWAVWCGPCRMLTPTVDEIAEEYAGRVTVAKCNVDDCQDIAASCGIRNIPTLLFFKDGKQVDRTVGVVSAAELRARIEKLL